MAMKFSNVRIQFLKISTIAVIGTISSTLVFLAGQQRVFGFGSCDVPRKVNSTWRVSNGFGSEFTVFNDELFFKANDGIHGEELWKYDGTSVSLVQDIRPGEKSSKLLHLTVFKNELVFNAETENGGDELWKYDGTSASLIQDIRPGNHGSHPADLTVLDNNLFFVANDGEFGCEPWKYDGTSVSMIKDINPGNDSSFINLSEERSNKIIFNGQLLFAAQDNKGGIDIEHRKLWKFDGTSISQVVDFNSTDNQNFTTGNFLGVFNNEIFINLYKLRKSFSFLWKQRYTYDSGLWKYDGDSVSLVQNIPIETLSFLRNGVVYNGNLFFSAKHKEHGIELWRYDGTSVSLVKDLRPGEKHSRPLFLNVFKGALFFSAAQDKNVRGFWKIEGNYITPIQNINPENVLSYSGFFTLFKEEIVFVGDDGKHGYELWRSDGTNAEMIADINPDGHSSPRGMTEYKGELFFTAYNKENGRELWKYDGVSISLVQDIRPGDKSGFEVIFRD